MRTFAARCAHGVLQIDSVNVLQRAHYMPLFSRMGPYDADLLRPGLRSSAPRRMVEYWAHVAAFMPVELWPHMRHRMAPLPRRSGHELGGAAGSDPSSSPSLLAEIARARRRRTARDLDDGLPRAKDHWGWNWSETKQALEYLFLAGELAIAGRNSAVRAASTTCPSGCCPRARPRRPDADRRGGPVELVRRAARRARRRRPSACLRDYFRMRAAGGPRGRRVDELVEAGELLPVRIEGWDRPAYLHRDAALPRQVDARALLEPVRPGGVGARAHRAPLRLPLPHRDLRPRPKRRARLLRAAVPARRPDRRPRRPQGRPAGRARCWCRRRYAEAGAPAETAEELAAELRDLAGWLGLDEHHGRAARRPGAAAPVSTALEPVRGDARPGPPPGMPGSPRPAARPPRGAVRRPAARRSPGRSSSAVALFGPRVRRRPARRSGRPSAGRASGASASAPAAGRGPAPASWCRGRRARRPARPAASARRAARSGAPRRWPGRAASAGSTTGRS